MATSRQSNRIRSRGGRAGVTLYSRSVVCSLGRVSEYQLRIWEQEELIVPARTIERGGLSEPLYDRAVLDRIRLIRTLAEELEVNLPGIGVILHLLDQMS